MIWFYFRSFFETKQDYTFEKRYFRNLQTICQFPGGEEFDWFTKKTILLEIACAPAIKVRCFGIIPLIAIAGPLESA